MLEFQDLVAPDRWNIIWMIVVGVVTLMGGLSLLLWQSASYTMESRTRVILSILGILICASSVLPSFRVDAILNDARDKNAVKFIDNIKTKYKISEVNAYEGYKDLSQIDSLAESNDNEIEVTVEDGTRFRFLITLNPETSEPTLIDPPINGGSADVRNLGTKELLKK